MLTDTQPLNFVSKSPLLVKIIGFIIMSTGFAVLFGWLYHIPILTSISSLHVSMKSNTAICFILSGIILLLPCNNQGSVSRKTSIFLSLIIILIGSLTLIEFITDRDLHIDQLFIKDYPGSSGQYHGRMAFVSALGFVFVGVAFLLKERTSGWISQTFALLVFFIGLFSFYNYIFGASANSVTQAYATMALHTTALFILLSLAILLSKPEVGIVGIVLRNTPGGYYLRRTLPLIFIVPMLISILQNKIELTRFIDANLRDSIMAAGTFVVLSLILSNIIRRMDREERKLILAKTELKHNEIIFYQFLENIDIVYYRTSLDLSKILYVSPAYENIWGKSAETLYKNSNEWFDSILAEDQEKVYEEFFIGMGKGNASACVEFRIRRPDGSIRNILSRGFQLKDENSKPFCMSGIAVDMTDVNQEKKYLHGRDDILRIIDNEKTISEAAPKILQMVCQMFNCELGEIWLIDEAKNKLRFVNNWHVESDKINEYTKVSQALSFKLGEGLPGMIWKERKPIWISDYSKRREFTRSVDAEKASLHCAFGMPIIFQDEIFGIMEFFSYNMQTPGEAMLIQMKSVGKLVGEFIHRVHTIDQIQTLSRRDILTGLLNHSALVEDLTNLINNIKSEIIAIMIIDIDKFKLVNEALGHEKGDLIIQLTARRLEKLIDKDRSSAARFGADKFIFYYSKIKDAEDITDFSKKIERSFKEPFTIDQRDIFLSVSIGISVFPQDGIDSKTLIANADQALTYAKKDDGNRSIFFTKELPSLALEKLAMQVDLHQAIKKNQFVLYYQPQIDLKTGNICCAEALVRWSHPIKGLIAPADFITYAEQTGLIVALNEHIIRLVFQQVKSGWTGPPISVNISALQFKDKYHLVEFIESLLKEFSADPKHVEFEITESLLMEDTQYNIAILAALHQLGFQFAIDDFGTGFSSFNYLYRIPAYKIKIDKSFIKDLPENFANAKIVKSILALLHSLGKVVVAEGAETAAEIEYLKNESCDIVQGYYYYKPMSTQEFIALITKASEK